MADLDVVVIGLNVVDALVRVPVDFQRGQKHRVEQMLLQGGGPAGNAACLLSLLGWRTGMVARLGQDALSQVARADFASHGVSADLFIDDCEARPAFAIVEIDSGDGGRTVYYSLEGYRLLSGSDVPAATLAKAKLVFTDGYEAEAALRALHIARDRHVTSVVDLEDGEPDVLCALLALADHAILPLGAGQSLTGRQGPHDVLRGLASLTNAQVIVTDGERGSWAWTRNGVHHQSAISVPVVDTTGCGDAYHGAYASALLEGQPLNRRMEFAAYLASRTAMHFGGRMTPHSVSTSTSHKQGAMLQELEHEGARKG